MRRAPCALCAMNWDLTLQHSSLPPPSLLLLSSTTTTTTTITIMPPSCISSPPRSLAQLKPAIKGMIQVLERYPDYQVALAAPSLKDVVTPTTQTPSTVPDAANACAASKDGADTFLTSKLATDSTFLSSLATLPYIGNMFQTVSERGSLGGVAGSVRETTKFRALCDLLGNCLTLGNMQENRLKRLESKSRGV